MTEMTSFVDIAGVKIENLSFAQAVERISVLATDHRAHCVFTPNVDHIVRLQKDITFKKAYREASLVVVDGMPIIWAAKFLGTPLKERVAGADLLPHCCAAAAEKGLTVYFLGAAPGVAQLAAEKLTQRYSQLKVAGIYSPPFGFEKDQKECQLIVDKLNASAADIVFVGLGSPKQEVWMSKYQPMLNIGVMLGIGAAIAFAAGVEKRAPVLMQKVGLEWLYRLTQNPRHLAYRYFKDLSFFWLIFKAWKNKR